MPPMMVPLLIVWASIVALLIVLLIYRSTLVMHEDDQLFLADSEGYMQQEQDQLKRTMGRIAPFVRIAQVGCGAVTLLIAGMWIWDAYKHF
jgi:hypothetical protein